MKITQTNVQRLKVEFECGCSLAQDFNDSFNLVAVSDTQFFSCGKCPKENVQQYLYEIFNDKLAEMKHTPRGTGSDRHEGKLALDVTKVRL